MTNDEKEQVKLCIRLLNSVLRDLIWSRSRAAGGNKTCEWVRFNQHICVALIAARGRLGEGCSPHEQELLYQAASRIHRFIYEQLDRHNGLYEWTYQHRPEALIRRRPTYAEVNGVRILWVRDMIRRYRELLK